MVPLYLNIYSVKKTRLSKASLLHKLSSNIFPVFYQEREYIPESKKKNKLSEKL